MALVCQHKPVHTGVGFLVGSGGDFPSVVAAIMSTVITVKKCTEIEYSHFSVSSCSLYCCCLETCHRCFVAVTLCVIRYTEHSCCVN